MYNYVDCTVEMINVEKHLIGVFGQTKLHKKQSRIFFFYLRKLLRF